ncbi:WxL protein peptidoglycan domain-containing protein [Aeromicrobium alkaliterrae]|uniref:DUF916 domain-containing protein n=1 Tax=Aeromicrobium alkaliterrae TaxID=302168 RepID=A0ABP4W2F3_9ACTN
MSHLRPLRLIAALGLALIVSATVATAAPVSREGEAPVAEWSIQPSTSAGPDGRPRYEYAVAPGTTISDWVSISNYSDQELTFRVHAADAMTEYDTGNFTLIDADQASTDLGAWTSVDSGKALCADTDDQAERDCALTLGVMVTIPAGQRADLPFTITIPADATPGDHGAGVVASLESSSAEDTSQVNLAQRVGSRIYVRVDGELKPGVAVKGDVASYDGRINPTVAGATEVGFDVENTGNTRVSVESAVTVSGPFGLKLGTLTPDPVSNLLPGETAHVVVDVPDTWPTVLQFASIEVTPVAADGLEGDPLPEATSASAIAWAVPWPIVLVLVAGGGFLVWRRIRRRRDDELMAAELSAYADQVRAATLAGQTGEPR